MVGFGGVERQKVKLTVEAKGNILLVLETRGDLPTNALYQAYIINKLVVIHSNIAWHRMHNILASAVHNLQLAAYMIRLNSSNSRTIMNIKSQAALVVADGLAQNA
jgi:hypothetical protein